MSIKEPGRLEVIADYVLNNRLINYLYKSYIDSLGLKGNETVLDFGSGSGAGSRHIAMILSQGNGRLTCLDISHRWMRIARKRMRSYPNVEYIVGDIRDTGVDACYDVIYIHFVLHEIDRNKRLDTAKALARRLKDTGRFCVREPIKRRDDMPAEEIRYLMTQSGLREIECRFGKLRFVGEVYSGLYMATRG